MAFRKAAGLAAGIAGVIALAAACSPSDSGAAQQDADASEQALEPTSFVTAYRRLTGSQYRHAVTDLFGDDIEINARFEPEQRVEGLEAVGNADLSITTSGLEQYYAVARSIADQVTTDARRSEVFGCELTSTDESARECLESFVRERGRLLLRRSLSDEEVAARMEAWDAVAAQSGDAVHAARLVLTGLLVDPEFLFRVERAEPDPAHAGELRLDARTKAARLSFMLWDAPPDAELLAAAESGELHNSVALRRQVDRLLDSPRFEDGVRAFFTDMLHFDRFETTTKDPQLYPIYSQAVADSAREETLRFLVRNLVAENRDYLDIFTSRDTVINRALAAVYQVPYPSREAWTNYSFSEDSERSGLLTQVTFASLFSHPGSSSPTIRGQHLEEIFMCTNIPDPPADVDFSQVQALDVGTVRERLEAHRTEPACAGCHQIMDPAGLALENFDTIGRFRMTENDAPIDVRSEINGRVYEGARGVGQYVRDNPFTTQCIVQRAHYYGVGRTYDLDDRDYLNAQHEAFNQGGHKLRDLFRNILSDPHFYAVVRPEGLTAESMEASSDAATASETGEG